MYALTFSNTAELNKEVSALRAQGLAVKVRKTENGFVAEVNEGGRPAKATPERVYEPVKADRNVWFYDYSAWQEGAEAAKNLRCSGKHVRYFKTEKCWVLKIVD